MKNRINWSLIFGILLSVVSLIFLLSLLWGWYHEAYILYKAL